jgi:hypothetical protein
MDPPECTRDLEDKRLSGLKGGTLDEMPKSRERELIESPPAGRASNEGEGGHPTVTTLTHNCSCMKELQGWKWKGA